jgi:hypothetical protein
MLKRRFITNRVKTIGYIGDIYTTSEIYFEVLRMRNIESELHCFFTDVFFPVASTTGNGIICLGIGGEYTGKYYELQTEDYNFEDFGSMLTYLSESIEDLFLMLADDYIE